MSTAAVILQIMPLNVLWRGLCWQFCMLNCSCGAVCSFAMRRVQRREWRSWTTAGSMGDPSMQSFLLSQTSERLAAASMRWGQCPSLFQRDFQKVFNSWSLPHMKMCPHIRPVIALSCLCVCRECTRGGFCNFMHLKPISRELRRELYGRSRRSKRR